MEAPAAVTEGGQPIYFQRVTFPRSPSPFRADYHQRSHGAGAKLEVGV